MLWYYLTMAQRRRYDILYSDLEHGTEEFGFIARIEDQDIEDEDRAYQKHVQAQLPPGQTAKVWDGYLTITEDS